jgi:transcriptional regulator GlxA family with amidase domain
MRFGVCRLVDFGIRVDSQNSESWPDAAPDGRNCWKYVLADRLVNGDDRSMEQTGDPREIVIVVYPQVQSLDVTGPLEVFTGAQRLIDHSGLSDRGYRVRIFSVDGTTLETSSGLTLTPHGALHEAPSSVDTLIVAGGHGCMQAADDAVLTHWIAHAARNARRTVSVCTGAFVLASAGLLEGRRATTHWASAEALARLHPAVNVDPEPIFLNDGPIWTSAGVTAGMDLALALVEDDLDRESALAVARHLVLFLRRPGGQSQFSATLVSQQPAREPLREAQLFAVENPNADLSVEAMADRAHMSPRHFARSFRAQVGVTPGRYVERVRIEAARRRLEDTSDSIGTIATACGFGTPETMRRVFLRTLTVGPAEYRGRFQSVALHPDSGVAA